MATAIKLVLLAIVVAAALTFGSTLWPGGPTAPTPTVTETPPVEITQPTRLPEARKKAKRKVAVPTPRPRPTTVEAPVQQQTPWCIIPLLFYPEGCRIYDPNIPSS